ncbi:MAG: methyltransferase domain-containing protein [Planctomycetota bacterium]|nr:methyltransferase domain-containing protein [Planctomycetota bacterium]
MADDCPKSDDVMHAESWEQRYVEGTTGWDLGGPPPALVALLSGLEGGPRRVLVPGCGNGHDAVAWAKAGHDVVAVDYAPSAVLGTRQNAEAAGVEVDVRQADLFALPADLDGTFDAIWEQTCYCAIHPSQRDAYVEVCGRVLKPGGRYHGLLWNHGQPGGPPFDVTPDDVRARFAAAFELESLAPVAESVPSRANEFLATFRRPA